MMPAMAGWTPGKAINKWKLAAYPYHIQLLPNLPLIQDEDPDLMNNDRWTVGEIDGTERIATYYPPEHLQYLLEKDSEAGGRPWIGADGRINPNARAEIEAEMAKRVKEA